MRTGQWMQTFSGRRFHPMDPRSEDIHIEDVAHALSNICRYTGHVKEFYSVAQHSVLVSFHCDHQLRGLLHDAPEAYICDLSRPLKQSLRQSGLFWYDEIEERLMRAVCDRFGLPHEEPEDVKRADLLLLVTEARDLMSPLVDGWEHTEANGWPSLPDRIVPLPPTQARELFLARFHELGGR